MHEALGVIRRAHKSTHTQKWMWWQRQEDQEIEITLSYIEEFKTILSFKRSCQKQNKQTKSQ